MDNLLKLHPNTIIEHLIQWDGLGDTKAGITEPLPREDHLTLCDDINWVFARWPAESVMQRTLSEDQHQSLKQQINHVPTGKQKHYRHALNAIMLYLNDIAQWQLPPRTDNLFIDRDLAWFERLSEQAEFADQLWQAYQIAQTDFLQTRATPSVAEAALTIAMDVAPLSLCYLASVLSAPNSLERVAQQTTLRVTHVQRPGATTLQTAPAFTRYHLTLYSYRLLTLFYDTEDPPSFTTKQLLTHLNTHITEAPYHLPPRSAAQWHAVFQALWHFRDGVPPTLLKDISQPERHVDFDATPPTAAQTNSALKLIYQRDWLTNQMQAKHQVTTKPRWPQRQLIRHWTKGGCVEDFPTPPLNADNILEYYLFVYCKELILYGGVIKEKLSASSIQKYSNIEICLANTPLRYAVAIDHDQLQQWAKQVYEQQENETHRSLVHYFFRFMATQALTDHFALDEFESPSLPPTVDPFRISLSALHDIVNALLSSSQGHLLQRFYCAISAILGYFAMLRRGELLRLRIKDIHYSQHEQNIFHVTVTKTSEGEPKSRKTRTVHTVLPEAMAKLVRIAMTFKKESHYNAPLIGFDGEKISSRQLNYLLPVTKALKAICGQAARFHHLRKSGIQLFMHQGLQLVYQYPSHELGDHADLASQLTPDMVAKRFSYWIENREQKDINDGLLFDELSRQIGHAHYATTRWSYLHGIQWLFAYLRPQQSSGASQAFSHAQLRFLLDLAPDSNDLSRQLMLISERYKKSTTSEKQRNPIMLTESELRGFIWQKSAAPPLLTQAPLAFNEPNNYYTRWAMGAEDQQEQFIDALFVNMLKAKSLDWLVLSNLWQHAGKHEHQPLSKKQRTALLHLGDITLIPGVTGEYQGIDSMPPTLHIEIAGNAKNASHFASVFRAPEWQWLTCSFVLTVNRKTKVARLLNLVKTAYAKEKEPISVIRQPEGASRLTIKLTPKFPVSEFVMKLTLQFLTAKD